MTIRVLARPVEQDSDTFEGFWNHEFYEYLVNHEAYYFEEIMVHVCTAESVAKEAVCQGLIPNDFQCPRLSTACIMHTALKLSAGQPLRLQLTFVPRNGI